jgi:hypothetical protein
MSRSYNTWATLTKHPGTMSETTYEGSCHCGAVRFQATMPTPQKAMTCNCSICSRAGWLLAFVPGDRVRLLQGDDALTDYQFGKKALHHVFCRVCGVRPFTRGNGHQGEPMVGVNLRCLSGLDFARLPVEQFDGARL